MTRDKVHQEKHPDYFTAILQMRNVTAHILSDLKKGLRKDNEKPFIAKEIKQKNGSDFYVSSNKFARRITRELISTYGGKYTESERIHTFNKQESKNVYRLNIFIEFPEFAKNDVMKFKDKLYKVKNIGKNVNLIQVTDGKSRVVEYKNLKDFEVLKKHETRVIRTRPYIEVMDEEHQPIQVLNKPKKTIIEGEKVKVVYHEGCYIV